MIRGSEQNGGFPAMKHFLIEKLQKLMFPDFVNSFEPRSNGKEIPGIRCLHNLHYGNDYPNSFLDLYQSPLYKEKPLPVFFYVHGGGYTWGDKVEGDPNAKESGFAFFEALLNAGFHVVSLNYALAPEYQYPVPLWQMDQCMAWLKEAGKEYGLDMNCIVLGGSSAGAHLSGQYAAAVCDPNYAEALKLKPVISCSNLLAFFSGSGLLDYARFDKTDSAVFNTMLRGCARAYFDSRDFCNNPRCEEANVIRHISGCFPPIFATDGNMGTFTDQARDLADRAAQLRIPCVLKLYDKKEAKLGHGYELGNTPQAKGTVKELVEFLGKVAEDIKK